MANLKPITQGMQQGAQAIQDNFNALNSAKAEQSGVLIRNVSAANAAWINNGGVILYRWGALCMAKVNGQAAQDIQANSSVFVTLPSGFTPIERFIYRTPDGATVNINTNGVTIDTKQPKGNYLVWDLSWFTNDPMPK